MARIWLWLGAAGVVVMSAIQLVPYGHDRSNPPVTQEPPWDRPQTRALAARACFDCHSNETVWPWYSRVAPLSWLIQRDVDEGRRALNYSEWDRGQREAPESAKSVRSAEMPPWFYTLPRPHARLTPPERAMLIAGLEATFGAGRSRAGDRRRTHADD